VPTILIQEDLGDDKSCLLHFADREVGDDLHPLRPCGNSSAVGKSLTWCSNYQNLLPTSLLL
ncbi:unnamed protein product, partial [Musa acuminata var. zebrina]